MDNLKTLTSLVIIPITDGARNPGMVAVVLEMPKSSEAYLGAISAWFTTYPAPYTQPRRATATVTKHIAMIHWVQSIYPRIMHRIPGISMPENIQELKILLCNTYVFDLNTSTYRLVFIFLSASYHGK